jgi:hypothetical protein
MGLNPPLTTNSLTFNQPLIKESAIFIRLHLKFFLIVRICHFSLIRSLFFSMLGNPLHKGFYRMKLFSRPIDLSGVSTVVYHLPDGPALSLKIEGIEEYLDLELELGHVCDTSDIDGVLHFFPKGNA